MFYSNKFKKFKNIKHCFFSKKGGFSKGIYKSLNCGKGSKDDQKLINKNLALVSKKFKINTNRLFQAVSQFEIGNWTILFSDGVEKTLGAPEEQHVMEEKIDSADGASNVVARVSSTDSVRSGGTYGSNYRNRKTMRDHQESSLEDDGSDLHD